MIIISLFFTQNWNFGYMTKIKKFKHEDDVFSYIDNYNTQCKIGSATITDFKILK